MKINNKEFEAKPLTRSQRKALRVKGFDLRKKAIEFQRLLQAKKGAEIMLDEIPLSDDDVDNILDIAFPDFMEDLEQSLFLDCLMLAGEVFMASLEDPAKN